MKRLVFIQNDPNVDKGSIVNQNIPVVEYKAWENPWIEVLPSDYVVVLGGHMGAYDTVMYPYLKDEKKWIENFVNDNGNLLGICLGSQMLADSIGGSALLSDYLEFGVKQFKVLSNNNLLNHFNNQPVFTWHRDTFKLPPGVGVLGQTEHPQIFTYKSSIGLQFHPEITLDLFDTWIRTEGSKEELENNRYDIIKVRDKVALHEVSMKERINHFINDWIFPEKLLNF
jgi:GMP synthase (glutamine-hydrolysing)